MNISRLNQIFILAGTFWGWGSASAELFMEEEGVVAMEAESTSSSLGFWEKKTDVESFSGTCHLEFTGNKTANGPPKSKLVYKFKVTKAGNYQLALRARKRLETSREDLSNDCYVAVNGDYSAGGDAPLSILQEDTKMYGGHADRWSWAQRLDSNHKKYIPIYNFKSGETYELVIHGRSKNFNIDRILFTHESLDLSKTQRDNPPESNRQSKSGSIPKNTQQVKRTLKNKRGVEIEAELISLKGNTLGIIKGGSKYEIPLSSLSEKDVVFIKKWAKSLE